MLDRAFWTAYGLGDYRLLESSVCWDCFHIVIYPTLIWYIEDRAQQGSLVWKVTTKGFPPERGGPNVPMITCCLA